MSDLLPLVIAALREKCLVDAKGELDDLHKRVDTSTSIEIIHDATNISKDVDSEGIVVYASGKFDDGAFYLTRNCATKWRVLLNNTNRPPCKLKDLGECNICVGGGVTIQSLRYEEDVLLVLGERKDGKVVCVMAFGGYMAPWFKFSIDGWPKEGWKPLINDEGEGIFSDWETAAKNYPEATVQFESISFRASDFIQGPLKRVLTNKRKQLVERVEDLRKIINGLIEYPLYHDDRDLDVNAVLGFFVYCNLHNCITTDELLTRWKAERIIYHVSHYKNMGLETLWQQEGYLKWHIENLNWQEARKSASRRGKRK